MGTAVNDITGDRLKSKPSTDKYRSGYDNINWETHKQFRQQEEEETKESSVPEGAEEEL